MRKDYINVDDDWGVILCSDLRRLDEYEMRAAMMSFGMRGGSLDMAVDILLFRENTGMCVSRDDIRMSLVFIGNATSGEQFWDTVTHELYHAASAICEHYYVRPYTEDFAWTMGFLMRKAVELLGRPRNDDKP